MKKIYLLIVSFLLAISAALPQEYVFSKYSLEEGLSQSVANCLYQDSKGFIWIGTQNGLNKFNGYSFEVYSFNPADTNSISNDWVYSICEDREGNLWIGTKNGLNKYIRKENKFERIRYSTGYGHEVTEYPYDAILSNSGKILINTPPVLTIFDPLKNTFSSLTYTLGYDASVKDNKIPLLQDSEGLVWIGSTNGLSCFNPEKKSFWYFFNDPKNRNSISDNNITALYEDNRGKIWIGTQNGLNVYDKTTKAFTRYSHDPANPSSLSHDFIRSIQQDNSKNMWIGTEGGGLSKITYVSNGRTRFENYTSSNSGLSHDMILSLLIDRSENLWIGTLEGLSKIDLKKPKFRHYRRDASPNSVDLLDNVIASIYKDDNGILWIGNWGQGLNLYDRKSGRVEHFSTKLTGNHRLANDFVHVIYEDCKRRIWIGTRDGILVFDPSSRSFIRPAVFLKIKDFPGFEDNRIFTMLQDWKGDYWIGTQNGLFRVNAATGAAEHFFEEAQEDHKLSSNQIYCLMEDRDGLIWIATLNGLDVYHPASGRISHLRKIEGKANSLCDNFVICLCEDYKGDIWIGTSSFVDRFSKKDSTFTYYSKNEGLPNSRIFEILEDDRHNLWFATGRGLCSFDTASRSFRTYTVEEGLQGLEFNIRASYRGKDGEMFFGGMNGVNAFYPDSLKDNPFIPPVVFTSFYQVRGGIKEFREIQNQEKVDLKYNQNTFTIEFAALEYTNPASNRYAFRMKGVSDDWIDLGKRHFIPFTNLPAGEYTLTVRGSNNDGLWNNTGISLQIIVHPPWWRTWIAYVAYGLIIIGMVMLYIRIRVRRLIRQRKILEEKVLQRTAQIERQKQELQKLNSTKDRFFSIIAHDLRSPFNTILGFTDLLLADYKSYDAGKVEKYLFYIKDAARHTFELLQNLLLWARSQTGALEYHPAPFDLKERIEESILLVRSQADKKNITTFHEIPGQVMAVGDRNMIDTVLRNFLTNAIKFTPKGGNVGVLVREIDSRWEIVIRDSGIGIAPENIDKIFRIDSKFTTRGTEEEHGTGLGLVLCREFVERHGSTIRVQSEPGKGSEFSFTLPKEN